MVNKGDNYRSVLVIINSVRRVLLDTGTEYYLISTPMCVICLSVVRYTYDSVLVRQLVNLQMP